MTLLHDGTREQLVRTCRATIGDELRSVGYTEGRRRECLYEREDLPAGWDARPAGPPDRPDAAHDAAPGVGHDATSNARRVEIVTTGTECAVFVCRGDDTVCRCDPESLTRFGEVGTAIASILESG